MFKSKTASIRSIKKKDLSIFQIVMKIQAHPMKLAKMMMRAKAAAMKI